MESSRWSHSLPSSRSLSIFFYLTSSYGFINNSKSISAQGVLVSLFGHFLHPSMCDAQVQGTFNEVEDQQHYRIHLDFTTAWGEAFKSPGILGCSYRHYTIKLDEILQQDPPKSPMVREYYYRNLSLGCLFFKICCPSFAKWKFLIVLTRFRKIFKNIWILGFFKQNILGAIPLNINEEKAGEILRMTQKCFVLHLFLLGK